MAISQALAPRQAKDRPFVLKKGISTLSDLKDGGAGYPGDYPGQVYYVNNISGNSAYDGLSWETPFAQVSEAVTASEAFRQLPALATNEYIRNIIYVQGTGTAYESLTALPSYCDLIGIGAEPRGYGAGIARIGEDVDSTAADGVDAAAVRGLNVYNMQFQAGSAKDAFDCENIFRSGFYNCAFMANGTAADPTAGFNGRIVSGLTMENCHFGTSAATNFVYGILISGTHFHNVHINNCFITGVTGIQLTTTVVIGYGSIVENSTFASGFTAQTASINDDSTTAGAKTVYRNNAVAVAGTLATNGTGRWYNNIVTNATAPTVVTAT